MYSQLSPRTDSVPVDSASHRSHILGEKPLNYIELYRYFLYYSPRMQYKNYLHRIYIGVDVIINAGRI